jgi:hypothetical protein
MRHYKVCWVYPAFGILCQKGQLLLYVKTHDKNKLMIEIQLNFRMTFHSTFGKDSFQLTFLILIDPLG